MKSYLIFLLLFLSINLKAQTNRELLAMKPKEFFAQNIIQETIDSENPNYHLLTIATFQATNLLREKLNMALFEPDNTLYGASKLHANQMIKRDFFDHINPYSRRFKTPFKRVEQNGGEFMIVAENIAIVPLFRSKKQGKYQYTNNKGLVKFYNLDGSPLEFMTYGEFGKSLVTDWYRSESHRENLLNKQLTHLGLAVRVVKNNSKLGELPEAYAVQNFGTKFTETKNLSN